MNGVPSLSVLDGWWLEGCEEGVTGWAVGPDEEPRDDHEQWTEHLSHGFIPSSAARTSTTPASGRRRRTPPGWPGDNPWELKIKEPHQIVSDEIRV